MSPTKREESKQIDAQRKQQFRDSMSLTEREESKQVNAQRMK